MSISGVDFRYVNSAEFDLRVEGKGGKSGTTGLVPGTLYFIEGGSVLHLADPLSADPLRTEDYSTYGGSQLGKPPLSPEDADPGVWYYDPEEGDLTIAVKMRGGDKEGELDYITVSGAVDDIGFNDDGNLVFIRLDGREKEVAFPKVDAILEANHGATNKYPTVKAVVDYVKEVAIGLEGGVRYAGSLTNDNQDTVFPGVERNNVKRPDSHDKRNRI